MKNGQTVVSFEKAFAEFIGARYCVALTNGTVTMQVALMALRRAGRLKAGVVTVPPLTMSSTTLAVLHAGLMPKFGDVHPTTWLLDVPETNNAIGVSLYGLHRAITSWEYEINDAAQTLAQHNPASAFTSYSFQQSKHLALGEGGMLATDNPELAQYAREAASLGYRLSPEDSRIDSKAIRSPDYGRHHTIGINARMNDITAFEGLRQQYQLKFLIDDRKEAAQMYLNAIAGCEWIQRQAFPDHHDHHYWTFAIALESKELWKPFTDAIVRHGGEMPYGAWRLTYQEPAFRHLIPKTQYSFDDYGTATSMTRGCPVAESLQPRLVQFQTNSLESAERNAKAVRKAIEEMSVHKVRFTHSVNVWADRYNRGDATGTPCS